MGRVILIVDDDEKSVKLARDVLQARGYATLDASNGKEGVELALEQKPDLILMDMEMPLMDGLAAASILKADDRTKDIPIIMLTASPHLGITALKEAGFAACLIKPVHIQDLLKTVAAFLGESDNAGEAEDSCRGR